MNRLNINPLIIALVCAIGLTLSVTVYQLRANDKPETREVVLDPNFVLPENELATLSDSDFGYTYQIPADWSPVEADDNLGGRFTTYVSSLSDDADPTEVLMGMSFAAHRASKFMPEPEVINPYVDEASFARSEDIIPYLPEGEIKTVGDYTIHISTERDTTASDQSRAAYGTTVYFLVEDVVYQFFITYTPPSDLHDADAGWSAYNQIINTIVYSVIVDTNAPFFVNRPQPVDPAVLQELIEAEMQQGPELPPPTSTPIEGYPYPN